MTEAQAAPKAKTEKPPAIEDKPLGEFMEQDYLPALKTALMEAGLADVDLSFQKGSLPQSSTSCWQVKGLWAKGRRSFVLGFPEDSIKGLKVFACADAGFAPTNLEPFLSDERKITLPLLVFGVIRRLNGQKWLGWN
ncbi:MAG: DUF2996 domain-containing protein [Prochlorothrix sp.]